MTEIKAENWRKSSYSNQTKGECVEIADTMTKGIAMRDTRNRGHGFLVFGSREWISFLSELRGENT